MVQALRQPVDALDRRFMALAASVDTNHRQAAMSGIDKMGKPMIDAELP